MSIGTSGSVTKAFNNYDIDICKNVLIKTDVAPNMFGNNVGFIKLLISTIWHPVVSIGCILSCNKSSEFYNCQPSSQARFFSASMGSGVILQWAVNIQKRDMAELKNYWGILCVSILIFIWKIKI